MRLLNTASFVAAVALVATSAVNADFVVNTNLGTVSSATSLTLTGTTVGGANSATTYTGANPTALWEEEFVFQFTTTAPFTVNLTTNDPNGGPTGPDNDFFLVTTLATPGGVGQALPSQPPTGFSGIEVSGSYGVQPAGTYYLVADSFAGGTVGAPTQTAISGTLSFVVAGGPVTPPPATAAILGGSISGSIGAGGEVDFYAFTYAGGTGVTFDTEGSLLAPSNDTELGLFSSTGALVASDDDGGTGLLSLLNSGAIPAGTYYLAVGGFNTTFAAGFSAISTSGNTGSYVINGLSVPEPTTLAALGLGGLLLRRRRA